MSDGLVDPTPELPDDTPLEKLRLPTRLANALPQAGLKTIGEVRHLSDAELVKLEKVGKRSVDYVRKAFGLPSHEGVRPPKSSS
jgi:DNA-directed RNA polymerase alpha subunit